MWYGNLISKEIFIFKTCAHTQEQTDANIYLAVLFESPDMSVLVVSMDRPALTCDVLTSETDFKFIQTIVLIGYPYSNSYFIL